MKTSIIYGPDYRYRGRAKTDVNEEPDPKTARYARAVFEPEHLETWSDIAGHRQSRTEPDRIQIGAYRFGLKRGAAQGFGSFKSPKVISPEYVARIHQVDEAVRRLFDFRAELLEEAASRGRPLKVEDCENGAARGEK